MNIIEKKYLEDMRSKKENERRYEHKLIYTMSKEELLEKFDIKNDILSYLDFALINTDYLSDKEFLHKLIKANELIYDFVDKDIQMEERNVEVLFQHNGTFYVFLPNELKYNKKYIFKCFETCDVFNHIPASIRFDKDILLVALNKLYKEDHFFTIPKELKDKYGYTIDEFLENLKKDI